MVMTLFLQIVLGVAVLLLPLGHRCIAEDNGVISRIIETEKTDFGNFYLYRAKRTRQREYSTLPVPNSFSSSYPPTSAPTGPGSCFTIRRWRNGPRNRSGR